MTKTEYYLTHFTDADSGKEGKAYEMGLREFFSGRHSNRVKAQGKFDAFVTFRLDGMRKAVTVEIKTACGDIGTADKSQFIIYCPEVRTDREPETQGYVFSREEWREFVNGYTGRGAFTRVDKVGRKHIQSFRSAGRPKASRPIAEYIWAVCESKPTAAEWITALRG